MRNIFMLFNWCSKEMILRSLRISTLMCGVTRLKYMNWKKHFPNNTKIWFTNGLPTKRIFMLYKVWWKPSSFKRKEKDKASWMKTLHLKSLNNMIFFYFLFSLVDNLYMSRLVYKCIGVSRFLCIFLET